MTIVVLPRLDAESLDPAPGHVCISITNPGQSPAGVTGFDAILRLGFHDTDRKGGNFTTMSQAHARQVLQFANEHRSRAITVHCEAGASRSVGVGVFLAAWLRQPLSLKEDVLFPNPLVVRQLRLAGLAMALTLRDRRLLEVSWRGPMALSAEFADPRWHIPYGSR